MSTSVEIIKALLKNKTIKKILIGENHFDYTPKEILIAIIEEIASNSFECGRKLVLVLEHLSIKEQELINAAVQNRNFSDEVEKIFRKFPFVDPENLSLNMFVELAKTAIQAGIQIIATENHETGYSSLITRSELYRIQTAGRAFAEAFSSPIVEEEQVVVVFLGGAAHVVDLYLDGKAAIMGLKTAITENNDTVSLYISDEGVNFLQRNIMKDSSQSSSLITIGAYRGGNFDKVLREKPTKKLLQEPTEFTVNAPGPSQTLHRS